MSKRGFSALENALLKAVAQADRNIEQETKRFKKHQDIHNSKMDTLIRMRNEAVISYKKVANMIYTDENVEEEDDDEVEENTEATKGVRPTNLKDNVVNITIALKNNTKE